MQKTAILQKIQQRGKLLAQIRTFFVEKNVLEVDTAQLRGFTVTDPYMSACSVNSPSGEKLGFLQTSPEYAMKQLLCDGSGDIFQLSKMFRADEKSPIHLCEFTMLEWYRLGFDHHQLIQEVCALITNLVGDKEFSIVKYRELFIKILFFDPFSISLRDLKMKAKELLGDIPQNLLRDNCLSLLFSEKIEPSFVYDDITVVIDYPASQASLAKTQKEGDVETADRFEVYLNGMELANGFNELTDADVQLARFNQDNLVRDQLGREAVEIDSDFVQSLKKGLPDCAGVALGIDRLLMIKLRASQIRDVVL